MKFSAYCRVATTWSRWDAAEWKLLFFLQSKSALFRHYTQKQTVWFPLLPVNLVLFEAFSFMKKCQHQENIKNTSVSTLLLLWILSLLLLLLNCLILCLKSRTRGKTYKLALARNPVCTASAVYVFKCCNVNMCHQINTNTKLYESLWWLWGWKTATKMRGKTVKPFKT